MYTWWSVHIEAITQVISILFRIYSHQIHNMRTSEMILFQHDHHINMSLRNNDNINIHTCLLNIIHYQYPGKIFVKKIWSICSRFPKKMKIFPWYCMHKWYLTRAFKLHYTVLPISKELRKQPKTYLRIISRDLFNDQWFWYTLST